MPTAASVTYNHSVNSRSLSAYTIGFGQPLDGAPITGRLASTSNEVANNRESLSGVFATIDDAIDAVAEFTNVSFDVRHDPHSGEYYTATPRRGAPDDYRAVRV